MTPESRSTARGCTTADRVTVVRVSGQLFLVTARVDGSVPINSRVLARLEECGSEMADEIARVMNRGLSS